jgi:hypothetical protein
VDFETELNCKVAVSAFATSVNARSKKTIFENTLGMLMRIGPFLRKRVQIRNVAEYVG